MIPNQCIFMFFSRVRSLLDSRGSDGYFARRNDLVPSRIKYRLGNLLSRLPWDLGCRVEGEGPYRVTPPSRRLDLELEEDLVEEIARLLEAKGIDVMVRHRDSDV